MKHTTAIRELKSMAKDERIPTHNKKYGIEVLEEKDLDGKAVIDVNIHLVDLNGNSVLEVNSQSLRYTEKNWNKIQDNNQELLKSNEWVEI